MKIEAIVTRYSLEVTRARAKKSPIVALESTIISHGLPRPKNLEVANEIEEIIRSAGATPATIAMIDGEILVGLEPHQLERIARDENIYKASTRDLAILAREKKSAATTVAATAHIAYQCGITVFATGGLGGVHRGADHSWDESADLFALANTSITVVCAGVKSILDIGATLERLESLGIPIVGYQSKQFPGFYLSDSGFTLEHSVNSPIEVASIIALRRQMATDTCALIVANPVKNQMDPKEHSALLVSGLTALKKHQVVGKAVTPFLLEHFHQKSNGESLRVNIEIIKSNALLAAQIAIASQ